MAQTVYYPSDLFSANYGGNYAIFYINTQEPTKLAESKEYGTKLKLDQFDVNQDMKINSKTNISGTTYKPDLNSGTEQTWLKDKKPSEKLTTSVGRPSKTLVATLALYMPNAITSSYATSWEQFESNKIGAEAMSKVAASGTASTFDSVWAGVKGGADAALDKSKLGIARRLDATIAGAGGGESALDTFLTSKGIALNQKKDTAFKGVDFRSFTLQYMFYARSEKEAKDIQDIITILKFYMHPETASGEFGEMYIYPAEFDIEYYHAGQKNTHLSFISSCILTRVSVDYTPTGGFTSFDGGRPTHINVSLDFKELAVLSRKDIAAGY